MTPIDAEEERGSHGDRTTDEPDRHGLGKGLSSSAALTGICRSGGLVDTLIRESIRVSWVSANPCPHSGQRGIPVGSASISGKICGYLRPSAVLFFVCFLAFLGSLNQISVNQNSSVVLLARTASAASHLANCRSFMAYACIFEYLSV